MKLFAVVFLFFSFNCCFSQDTNVFLEKKYIDSSKDTLLYRFHEIDNPQKKFPLVVFFHGAGERGNDNKKQLEVGIHILANTQNRAKYPCYILAAQCPDNLKWVNTDWTADSHNFSENPSKPMKQVIELIDILLKKYSIDPKRIYVIGLSMGGFAVWDIISRFPNKFAAAVPICGGGDEKKAKSLSKIPIWVFHGEKDKVVKTLRSRNMVTALKKAGGNPKYTEYKDVGHNCWGKTFNDDNLYKWLFLQSKK